MDIAYEKLRKLPVVEKLRLVERLWDDIHDSDEPLVIQDWHKDEARRRAAELAADPSIGLTTDEMWKRVNELNG